MRVNACGTGRTALGAAAACGKGAVCALCCCASAPQRSAAVYAEGLSTGTTPLDDLENEQLRVALDHAIGALPLRQREVFVAIALNDVSIDVLALQLRSSRNAIYKNLFDARRTLRARMAAAGHPVAHEDEIA